MLISSSQLASDTFLMHHSLFIPKGCAVHFSQRLCPSVSEIITDLWVIFHFLLSNIWCQNGCESLRSTLSVQCTPLPLPSQAEHEK